MKKINILLISLLILAFTGCFAVVTSSSGNTSMTTSPKVFGELAGSYDYVYLHPNDLFDHSTLVLTGEFSSDSRSMVVSDTGEPSVVTYFNFKVDDVIKGTYTAKEIEVFAAGGTTTVAEYMSKALETQWVAAGIKNIGSKDAPSFEKDGQIVDQQLIKYNLKDQFNLETGKKFLLFLGGQDNLEYRILGDRWGALLINNDSVTDSIDNSIIKISELSK